MKCNDFLEWLNSTEVDYNNFIVRIHFDLFYKTVLDNFSVFNSRINQNNAQMQWSSYILFPNLPLPFLAKVTKFRSRGSSRGRDKMLPIYFIVYIVSLTSCK